MAKDTVLLRPIPVDGGWGWFVVFGSFVIHILADGFVYSFGIMVVQLLETFHGGRGVTSWIVSTLVGLTLGAGPVASAITHRFGCRTTTIAGAIIASFGCALSFFATNVIFLMVSVGVVMGIGFGLIYCPAIVIVTMYFEERRAFATGIAVCGAGVGTFIFAPLTTYLIETYTWRGAFLIYAGLILNCVVCGALFRPLEFEEIPSEEIELEERSRINTVGSLDAIREDAETLNKENPFKNGVLSLEAINKPENKRLNLEARPFRTFSHTDVDQSASPPSVKSLSRAVSVMDSMHSPVSARMRRRGHSSHSESAGYMSITDVFYPGSITRIPEYISHPDLTRSIMSLPHEMDGKGVGHVIPEDEEEDDKWAGPLSVFRQMANFSLLKDPVFLMFALSNFFTSVGLNPPLVFLPDRANKQLGIPSHKASWIISAFGITNTLGRVIVGYIADSPIPFLGKAGQNLARNRLWLYNIMLIISGISTLLSSFCSDFTSLMIYSLIYGFTLSAYICLISVILVDLLGLEKLTNAFGLLLLFQGIASLIGSPIAGWIIDISGNYDYCFYFCGASILLSGLIMCIVPWLPHEYQTTLSTQNNNKS